MKTIRTATFSILAVFLLVATSCKKETIIQFSDQPVGTVTNLKTGTIARQNAPGTPDTKGTLSIIQDSNSNQFVKLNSDFMSGFATGTVTVYLAKTMEEIKVQRNGGATATNVQAIGFVQKNGEQYLKIAGSISGFTYLVLYCETAEVNFGAAQLK